MIFRAEEWSREVPHSRDARRRMHVEWEGSEISQASIINAMGRGTVAKS